MSTEELDDGDWYYQIHSYLEYTPKSEEKISCMVEHGSFNKPMITDWAAARHEARPKHTAARIHPPEERTPPDAMTSNTNVIVIRSLSPAPGKLRENKTFSNFPTSSSASPMIAATIKPQHKQGPEPPGRDANSSSLGKSAKREQSLTVAAIIGLADELVGKFEKVLFSLNFPGAGESDQMMMTFMFDVIASGSERSSGWCMRAAVCLGRASRRAAAAGRAS
ncbi:H-2 class II histocompatibility antigen, A-S beta chain [Anabarilius grahami]|uniref:H-2 class II histocompatibility antigen, A-S beta chain n=1 Tax=Anabarilius grahami TaxID=495550 RepID=A0A3N0XHB2_ANAGA|nr:H-2 class II histocompatibility antigen, A-S beta chain [Anabarilius grahami]